MNTLLQSAKSLCPAAPQDHASARTTRLSRHPGYHRLQPDRITRRPDRRAETIEIAQDLLAHFGNDIRRIYQAHPRELAKVKGISGRPPLLSKLRSIWGYVSVCQPMNASRSTRPADAAALVQSEMALWKRGICVCCCWIAATVCWRSSGFIRARSIPPRAHCRSLPACCHPQCLRDHRSPQSSLR